MNAKLSARMLATLLRYDPVKGTLHWRKRTAETFQALGYDRPEAIANTFNARYADMPVLMPTTSGQLRLRIRTAHEGMYNVIAQEAIWYMLTGEELSPGWIVRSIPEYDDLTAKAIYRMSRIQYELHSDPERGIIPAKKGYRYTFTNAGTVIRGYGYDSIAQAVTARDMHLYKLGLLSPVCLNTRLK